MKTLALWQIRRLQAGTVLSQYSRATCTSLSLFPSKPLPSPGSSLQSMLITNRENKSVPALAGTGLANEALRRDEWACMREMSSDTVDIDDVLWVMRSHSALIAAIGCGSEGDEER